MRKVMAAEGGRGHARLINSNQSKEPSEEEE
jgi:hypothetical protein